MKTVKTLREELETLQREIKALRRKILLLILEDLLFFAALVCAVAAIAYFLARGVW